MPFRTWIYIYSAIVSDSDLRNINSKVHYWNVLSNYGIHLSFENLSMQILHKTQRLDISGWNNFIWGTSIKYFKSVSSDKCSPKFYIREQNDEMCFSTSSWSAILLCLATKVNQTPVFQWIVDIWVTEKQSWSWIKNQSPTKGCVTVVSFVNLMLPAVFCDCPSPH